MSALDTLLALAGGSANIGAQRKRRYDERNAPMQQGGDLASQFVQQGVRGTTDYLAGMEKQAADLAADRERTTNMIKARKEIAADDLKQKSRLEQEKAAREAQQKTFDEESKRKAGLLSDFAREQAKAGVLPDDAYKNAPRVKPSLSRTEVSKEDFKAGDLDSGLLGRYDQGDIAAEVRKQEEALRVQKLSERGKITDIEKDEAAIRASDRRGTGAPDPSKVLRDKLLGLQIEDAERKKKQEEGGGLGDTALKSVQTKRVEYSTNFANNVKTFDDLMRQYGPGSQFDLSDYTGPIDKIATFLKTKYDLSNDEDVRAAADIQSAIKQGFNEYKLYVTGAAASDKEMKGIEQSTVGMDDNVAAITGKLDAHRRRLTNVIDALDLIIKARDVAGADEYLGIKSKIEKKAAPAAPADPAATARVVAALTANPNLTNEQLAAILRGGK